MGTAELWHLSIKVHASIVPRISEANASVQRQHLAQYSSSLQLQCNKCQTTEVILGIYHQDISHKFWTQLKSAECKPYIRLLHTSTHRSKDSPLLAEDSGGMVQAQESCFIFCKQHAVNLFAGWASCNILRSTGCDELCDPGRALLWHPASIRSWSW